jgi:hypothetical protein
VQTIFKGALTGTFQPSQPFLIMNGLSVVDFALVVGAGPAQVEWYFELTSSPPGDPVTEWFRELSEETPGLGLIDLVPTVRRFQNLVAGNAFFDNQSAKAHDFCRVQLRVAAGTASATLRTPFGLPAT